MNKFKMTVGEVADIVGGRVDGDVKRQINGLATLSEATDTDVAICVNKQYAAQLSTTKAAVVVLPKNYQDQCPVAAIVVDDPYLAYAKLTQHIRVLLLGERSGSIAPSAVVSDEATVDETAILGPNVVVGARSAIGPGAEIGANTVIGAECVIGPQARIHPNVTIYDDVQLGARCIVHSGAVIGSDGFGFAEQAGAWHKIEQLGGVRIADDVEIGANTTIDRGALDNTVIKSGVKLDNQIQIAHNVQLGENAAFAAGVAVAGSTTIGKNVRAGGYAAFNGHITVCDNVFVSGMGMVTRSITQPGIYSSGIPARPNNQWKRNVARFQRLDDTLKKMAKKQKENSEEGA